MDKYINVDYSWLDLVFIIAILAILFIFLKLAKRIITYLRSEKTLRVNVPESLSSLIDKMLLLFEPIATLLVFGHLFLINPYMIGFIGIVFIIFTYSYIRNYFIGRTLMLNDTFINARQISTGGKQGNITHRGRLGLRMQTSQGVAHIPYLTLAREGYTVLSGSKIGHQVVMTLAQAKETIPLNKLSAMLLANPFLDHQIVPELEKTEDDMIIAKLVLKEKDYLDDLEEALEEWGFTLAHHQFKAKN